jgi:L-threonylcarbamoyladenylate synthase
MQIGRSDLELQERYYLPVLSRSLFIHPTDSHYSIGCDATNKLLVMRLRLLKRWHSQPFSVIAPSKDWIRENLDVPEEALEHFPGPVTIVARLKNDTCVANDVHLGYGTLGVRIPDHWISQVVARLGVPVVTSCANKKAECLMTSLENADKQLVEASAVVLHEGPKNGRPTVFIDYTEGLHIIE